ncbi:hypothetical protein E2C01_063699 [Portunus trituberculatus]|uniref:Uncharacterized protein n=1 Tax=Portunus trituberculatus TaxID=210409 RepID=A0A5B7HH27_PORTR|nr:hypothetical protein [Portunus trituberculatus]
MIWNAVIFGCPKKPGKKEGRPYHTAEAGDIGQAEGESIRNGVGR